MKNLEGHPRMLGIAIAAGALALIMTALSIRDAASGHALDAPFTAYLLIGALAFVSAASLRLHLRLRKMTPGQRNDYWTRFEQRHDKDRRDPPFGGLG